MKLSNILLASMISSGIGVSAQVSNVVKDSLVPTKNSTEISLSTPVKDSTKLREQRRKNDSIKIHEQKVRRDSILALRVESSPRFGCPACGRG
ncbi:hypothetical protein M601_001295 [Cellulophaga baltica 4]|uniref:hypothetical protein n=1 Tax=Cellulophaga TaxID=104264 RepID=UPI000497B93F|nr:MULTISPECIES: hypothetical protein [unclassified Cellulophaga]QXP53257.1 hypothetical protein H0I24_04800 [Cellulophaga sp. HaHa_2_1]WFO16479.1 hypothetical protein M601_001295 [Cellulophaga baltica 4]